MCQQWLTERTQSERVVLELRQHAPVLLVQHHVPSVASAHIEPDPSQEQHAFSNLAAVQCYPPLRQRPEGQGTRNQKSLLGWKSAPTKEHSLPAASHVLLREGLQRVLRAKDHVAQATQGVNLPEDQQLVALLRLVLAALAPRGSHVC